MITEAIRNDPTFSFLVLGIVLIFAPLIAERLRMPGLLGLLIGGALIGPHMLGILDDFRAIESVGQIGILYLIFLAGLQMDLESFRRFRRTSGGFGMITSLIPFALGTLITLQLGYELKAAILIGSFWASFTLIAYPVLKQFDLTKNRAGAATLGASAITDTVSLLVLALVAGSETGDHTVNHLNRPGYGHPGNLVLAVPALDNALVLLHAGTGSYSALYDHPGWVDVCCGAG
jgi:Kef-type K+ transport system membrane component KefB